MSTQARRILAACCVGVFNSGRTAVRSRLLLPLAVLLAACAPLGLPRIVLQSYARFENPDIRESSGIVKSRRLEGVFWTHNDSGDRPRLFALERNGASIGAVDVLGAAHIDWEDIAIDDNGFLYLCDIGNNSNRRRNLVVYRVPEVDPGRSNRTTVSAHFRFRYPAHLSPDAEACFFAQGSLYLLTKEPEGRTELYRLSLTDPTGEETVALVGKTEIGSPVTAADITPDGRRLAVLSYSFIALFERPKEGNNYLSGARRRMPVGFGQCEAIAWDGADLLLANEEGGILRLKDIDASR